MQQAVFSFPVVAAICLGASAGALARYALGQWLNQTHAALPWGTLAANWVGALLVGLVIGVLQARADVDPLLRLLLVTGFLGALTTFSTFSAEAVALLQAGRALQAFAHSALHLLGSLALTWVGLQFAMFYVVKK